MRKLRHKDHQLEESDLERYGFTRDYPTFTKGDVEVYALEDDDRADTYYLVEGGEHTKRLRTVGDLVQILNQ